LHVVERYRLLDYEAAKDALQRDAKENQRLGRNTGTYFPNDPNYRGKHLQLHFTVQDEGVFTTPWSATITYRRPPSPEWPELVCNENERGFYAAGKRPSLWPKGWISECDNLVEPIKIGHQVCKSVIRRNAQGEHFSSAISGESRLPTPLPRCPECRLSSRAGTAGNLKKSEAAGPV
jgi:hypothetical protein